MTAYDFLSTHRNRAADVHYHFKGHQISTDQITRDRLSVVWNYLEIVLDSGIRGSIVELGCYAGSTSQYIRRLLDEYNESDTRDFHVYDSFAGLPDKVSQDSSTAGDNFISGSLRVSKKDFVKEFQSANLQMPIIHKGWFSDIEESDVPSEIAFAFLDGDLYTSIMDSLQIVWSKMQPGGYVLIDDYDSQKLPGVTRAVNDFFKGSMPNVRHEHNIAVLKK